MDGRWQPGIRADALARHLTAVILGAHVHFWDPGSRHYAWLDDQPSLLRRFGPAEYDGGRHAVSGMIFVQADCQVMAEHIRGTWTLRKHKRV